MDTSSRSLFVLRVVFLLRRRKPKYRESLLNSLGNGLSQRYAHNGELVDLERAIYVYQQALQATPPNSPEWPRYLNSLGNGLSQRYAHNGELVDLEAAINAYQQALQATPPNSPEWPRYLNSLGNGLSERYARSGELTDLEQALAAWEAAVQQALPGSPEQPRYPNSLGNGLSKRYAHSGELADLEAAINAYQQALQATPPNSPDRPIRLSNLGSGLQARYDRTGNLADLEAAISAHQQALQITPPNSPERPALLNSLGSGLQARYDHTGNLADLEAAISAHQQALQITPHNSPGWHRCLNNLGSVLLTRYERTEELADLEEAITVFQQALQTTPPDSPDRPRYLSSLGSGLQARYVRTGELADLEEAITVFQQALQATPPNSPDRPIRLSSLGSGLQARYVRTGNLADLEAAVSAWERSLSIPYPRFAALPVTYQLGQLRRGAWVAAHLVTAYLEQAKQLHPGSPSVLCRAVEIAESSKSRLLTQLVGRGSLTLPSGLSQEIAIQEQRFLADLTALDTQELASLNRLAPSQEEISHLQRLQQRQATLRGLEDLWTRIAQVGPEGTAYVALRRGATPTWEELAGLAKALGPATALLCFFMTTDQALLFLLRSDWPTPCVLEVPLNQAGWDDLLERFSREVQHYYLPRPHLRETWDQPLRPLLTKAQPSLEGVERLILTPAGIGHLLPWGVLAERAGWRTSAGQPLPLVTLPALGILPRLRQRQHILSGPAVVIGDTRGDLPYVADEAKMVAERFGTEPLLGAAATKSAVLTRLSEATLIHLATHAFFDANNPLESGIVLADGVLTAREVLQHRLQADLLVLSAGETGLVGSLVQNQQTNSGLTIINQPIVFPKMFPNYALGSEELAGLSQAFLQAGVRSLIVSLWQVNDPATVALMQAFYTAWQAGADKALALRHAMTQIQQNPRWSHPYYWGAFVLVGDWE